ncbi:MAG: hypothetical protein KAW00_07195, partial [Dehalococcoidia bacterium]|nr:hypothetical protein [Dehalococcoidia bacterium]
MLTLLFMKGLNLLLESRQIMAAHFKRELAPSLNSFQARSKAKSEIPGRNRKTVYFCSFAGVVYLGIDESGGREMAKSGEVAREHDSLT